ANTIFATAAPGTYAASVTVPLPAVSDYCGIAAPPTGVRDDGLALTAPYPIGETRITWTATDIHGLTSTTVQIVHVDVLRTRGKITAGLLKIGDAKLKRSGGFNVIDDGVLKGELEYQDATKGINFHAGTMT